MILIFFFWFCCCWSLDVFKKKNETAEQTCSCHSTRVILAYDTQILLSPSGWLFLPSDKKGLSRPVLNSMCNRACHIVFILTLCGVNGAQTIWFVCAFLINPVNYSLQASRLHCIFCVRTSGLYVLLPDSLTAQVMTLSYCEVKASHCGRWVSLERRVNLSQNSPSSGIFPRKHCCRAGSTNHKHIFP